MVSAGHAPRGWLKAWPFMAEAAIPIWSFKTFYITGYFCGSKYMVEYKAAKELCKLFNEGNDLS